MTYAMPNSRYLGIKGKLRPKLAEALSMRRLHLW